MIVTSISFGKDRAETPQDSILKVSEDVGKVIHQAYQDDSIKSEVSKQKTDCDQCQRKQKDKTKYKIKLKIKKFFGSNFKKSKHKNKSFKKNNREHELFKELYNTPKSQRKAVYQKIRKEIGCGEKMIDFMAKVGRRFENIYDQKRKKQGLAAKGKVSCEELFSTLSYRQKTGKKNKSAGVCRDHTVCLAQMVSKICPKLGKNTCALSYSTPGSYHQTLVTKTGGKTHHLSYMKRLSTENNGTSGIQAVKESSASYHLWCGDKNGKMRAVQQIPSELGYLLNEIMGGNNSKDFDPLARPAFNIVKSQITSESESSQANIFYANLSNGDRVFGLGASTSWLPTGSLYKNNILDVEITAPGLVGASASRRELVFPSLAKSNKDEQFIYGVNLQQALGIPITLKLNGGTIEALVSGNIHALGIASEVDRQKETKNWSGSGILNANLHSHLAFSKDNNQIKLSIDRQYSPSLPDSRALKMSNFSPILNFQRLSLSGVLSINNDVAITPSLNYQENGSSDTLIIRKVAGGSVGVNTKNTQFDVSYNKTLENDINVGILPGGSESWTLGAKLSHKVNSGDDYFSISPSIQGNINSEDQYEVFLTIEFTLNK